MSEEKYILDCPDCGPVEGRGPAESDDHGLGGDVDMALEEQAVRTAVGRVTRVRCPRCRRWVEAERVRPA